jgi:hypothetical protein
MPRHVLLTRRYQFLRKISALAELVDEYSFSSVAEELEADSSQQPDGGWVAAPTIGTLASARFAKMFPSGTTRWAIR